ncbi:BDP1 factor, partial [Odontophorus gujanensis]|nr:BDP1 factor [Odontophorus gujanensis]
QQNSSDVEEAAPFTQAARKHDFTDSIEKWSCKRIRQNSSFQSPEIPLECESQVRQEDSQLSTSQQKKSDNQTRLSRRTSKQIALPKHGLEMRTGSSSASECEADPCEKGNQRQEVKLNVTRGKSMKNVHRKKPVKELKSSKTNNLVTLRASQEDVEEANDFEPDDEDECFAPEEVNKAPVFVPVGLRSPKAIPVQIEETMEELDVSVNIPDVPVATDVESLSHVSVQPIIQKEEKGNTIPAEATVHEDPEVEKGISDGSTEAAMTLLAMGDPMFQLKASNEEWTCMLPAQDELNMASSLVTHDDSEQNRAANQYVVSSATSAKVPCKDGSNINIEDQSAGAGTGVQEYFENNATDTSNSSLHESNTRLRRGSLQKSSPDTGELKSSESAIQSPLNINLNIEQQNHVQRESMDLRGTAEMQKVEPVVVGPTSRDSAVLQHFATSMELVKQMNNEERTQKEMIDVCGTSRNLSSECEKSHLGLEDCLDESSVDTPAVQNPCPAMDIQSIISFAQVSTLITVWKCPVSQTLKREEIFMDDDHRCPEEEQTFILTLVEILGDSEEFSTSALLEQTSEPLLPAPILISPVKSSGTSLTDVQSIGSSTTAADEFGECSNSSMEITQQQSASVEPILNLVQVAQKRSAAELAENDFPLAKKTISTVVESNVESPCQVRSFLITLNSFTGNPLQKTGASVKKNVLTSSALLSESVSPVDERNQCEISENLGRTSFHNLSSSQEEEVTSRLASNRKTEISEQGKLGDVYEAAQLEHSKSLTQSSITPLLRYLWNSPLGFLSLICRKERSESSEEVQRKRGKITNPEEIGTTKQNLNKTAPSNMDDRESCSFPSRSTSSFVEYDSITADAVVTVPSSEPSEKPPHCAEDQEKEEEPTKISEYFFSDIFMEVDDPE